MPLPLDVPETDRIAALLAEVMPQAAAGRSPDLPPEAVTQNVRAFRSPVPSTAEDADQSALGQRPVRELLGQANWRNEVPGATVAVPPPTRAARAEPGPLPAPFGVLTVSTLFDLVNWRNRPDEAQPLPVIQPPPPPGSEFTVEAMLPMFGWE
jgi:hypothetical protein